jgi:hypothetical protein
MTQREALLVIVRAYGLWQIANAIWQIFQEVAYLLRWAPRGEGWAEEWSWYYIIASSVVGLFLARFPEYAVDLAMGRVPGHASSQDRSEPTRVIVHD